MIDARTQHTPEQSGVLIVRAASIAGSQTELARRVGLTRESIRRIANGDQVMSYTLQVTLEAIARE